MKKGSVKKAVLAYSGGLDTTVILPWLRENYGCEVICFSADIGQGEELDGLETKAMACGASKLIIKDLREEFASEYIYPMVQAGAVYEDQYLLGTAIARPLIAKWLAKTALEEGADTIVHGCTGKGNDQVRFELGIKSIAPELQVIAPWREWSIRSREDAVTYAEEKGLGHYISPQATHSRDRNLWHMSHEGAQLEDPSLPADESVYLWTTGPEDAPEKGQEIQIAFEQGKAVSIDGITFSPAELIEHLNDLGARHGIGRVDLVENRLVGMKSRGVYETPGGTILYAAHRELESICLDRDTLHFKQQVALKYAELLYFGKWFTPLRNALQQFIDYTQQNLTGWVRLKLYKGNVTVLGRSSPYTLYREDLATFGASESYDQEDATGFIHLFGLQARVTALVQQENRFLAESKATASKRTESMSEA
ncbi:MAG: argininosuccinate synthase [Anaerolineales bacterium]|nr:argininosuccinate synthase [Anaerolineales bacterium]